MKSNRLNLSSLVLLATITLGGASWGCMMGAGDMQRGNSQGTSEVRSGIDVGREGIRIAREGLASFHGRDQTASLEKMVQGMDMMSEGMNEMRGGFDMMSGGMTSGGMMSAGTMSGGMMDQCGCDGGQLMTTMRRAMEDVQQGHDLMTDDDCRNDQMGADKMVQGMEAMEAGYIAAEQAMSCMDDAQGGGMM